MDSKMVRKLSKNEQDYVTKLVNKGSQIAVSKSKKTKEHAVNLLIAALPIFALVMQIGLNGITKSNSLTLLSLAAASVFGLLWVNKTPIVVSVNVFKEDFRENIAPNKEV